MTVLYSLTVVLAALAGWAITGWLGGARTTVERASVSVWVGYLAVSFSMWLVALAGLPIHPLVYLPAVALVAGWGVVRLARDPSLATVPAGGRVRPIFVAPVVIVTVALMALILGRCLVLPNRVYNSITSFDLLATAIAAEEVFRVSLFDHTPIARGGTYPPFLPLTLAWGYQTGLATAPQALLVPLVAFFAWMVAFARRLFGPTTAWVVALAALLSPDFNSYVQLPVANGPVIVFAAFSFGYLIVAVRDDDRGAWRFVAAALVGLAWSRANSLAIVFGIAVAAASFARGRPRVLLAFPALAVAGTWQLYAERVLGAGALERLAGLGGWDGARVTTLVRDGAFVFFNLFGMGAAGWLFVIGAVVVVVRGSRHTRALAVAVAVAVLVYTWGFYFIDPVKQDPLAGLLRSTYRRGLTAFVLPMGWLFLLSPLGEGLRRGVGRRFG